MWFFFFQFADDDAIFVYDDACHLDRFKRNPKRANINETTKIVAKIECWIDRMHARNHKTECQEKYSSYRAKSLQGVDTEACEQLFSWLSSYRFIVKHMNRHRFLFFIWFLLWQRNLQTEKRLKQKGKWNFNCWMFKYLCLTSHFICVKYSDLFSDILELKKFD